MVSRTWTRAVATVCAGFVAAWISGPLLVVADQRGGLPPNPRPRSGVVRVEGRTFADEAGPWNASGASLFWLAWGFEHDRARLAEELAFLAQAGFDYVRALAAVGPDRGWHDRTIDPTRPGWEQQLAGAQAFAYAHGLRVQWTIFGGVDRTPTPASRRAAVETVARVVNAHPEQVFAVEIGNESWQNGFDGPGGLSELRALGAHVARRVRVPVALTSPATDGDYGPCAVYGGAEASFVTMHYPREGGPEGLWRHIAQPWRWGETERAACAMPPAVSNNEPMGPQASGEEDASPGRLTLGFAMTFLGGNGAHVFHSGPGIRGGGESDREAGRSSSFKDLDPAIFKALERMRALLPQALAGWRRHDSDASEAVFKGLAEERRGGAVQGAYQASNGSRAVLILLNQSRTVRTTVAVSGRVRLYDARGVHVRTDTVHQGGVIALPVVRDGGLLAVLE
jgi:hypothetical protein